MSTEFLYIFQFCRNFIKNNKPDEAIAPSVKEKAPAIAGALMERTRGLGLACGLCLACGFGLPRLGYTPPPHTKAGAFPAGKR